MNHTQATTPVSPVVQKPGSLVVAVVPQVVGDDVAHSRATLLADWLGLQLVRVEQASVGTLILQVTAEELALAVAGDRGLPVSVDLTKLDIRSSAGRTLRQPIARALGLHRCGAKRPWVLDATAGWGEDTWLLAAFGCRVLAVERHPVVAALLADGLTRAAKHHPEIASRITVQHAEAGHLIRTLMTGHATTDAEGLSDAGCPDAVYIDPMFPVGRKTAERKPMVMLRRVVGDDPDAAEVALAAIAARVHRIVVKRPLAAPPLLAAADIQPSHSVPGKGFRFDVYIVNE